VADSAASGEWRPLPSDWLTAGCTSTERQGRSQVEPGPGRAEHVFNCTGRQTDLHGVKAWHESGDDRPDQTHTAWNKKNLSSGSLMSTGGCRCCVVAFTLTQQPAQPPVVAPLFDILIKYAGNNGRTFVHRCAPHKRKHYFIDIDIVTWCLQWNVRREWDADVHEMSQLGRSLLVNICFLAGLFRTLSGSATVNILSK